MTSTPLKDVGSAAKTFMAGNAPDAGSKAAGASFQEVWNNQTKAGQKSENAMQSKDASVQDSVAQKRPENVGKSQKADGGDKVRTDKTQNDEVQTDEAENEIPEEKLEEAIEVLGTAASELLQQIADTFGISMEDLQSTLASMQMQPADILQSANMSALLLQIGGEQDSLALLTNEKLYGKFQTVMQQLDQTLQTAGQELGMNPEQLMQMVTEMQPVQSEMMESADAGMQEENIPVEIQITAEDLQLTTENLQTAPEENVAQDLQQTDAETSATEEGSTNVTVGQESDVGQTQNADAQNIKTANQTEDHAGHEKNEQPEDKGQNGNLLLQNLKNDSTNAQVQQLTESSLTWDTDTQDIMKQIMDYMKLQIKPDTSNLEMQLHPASLGTLQVQVASKGGVVTAHFVTQNETVKAALESQMVQLKENFQEQGVKVEAIEVSVQTHEFERNLDQGRGRQQNEAERKTRTRRINLNELTDSGFNELEEEEAIAADMMAANGNTVDYTA